jgi:hypothetical protein
MEVDAGDHQVVQIGTQNVAGKACSVKIRISDQYYLESVDVTFPGNNKNLVSIPAIQFRRISTAKDKNGKKKVKERCASINFL